MSVGIGVAVALLLAAVGLELVCEIRLTALNRRHKLPVFTARYAVKPSMRVMAYRGAGAGSAGMGAAVLMDGPWDLELVHRMLFAGLASGTAVLLPALVVSVAHNRAVRAETIEFP